MGFSSDPFANAPQSIQNYINQISPQSMSYGTVSMPNSGWYGSSPVSPTHEFKVGDKVELSPNSVFYDLDNKQLPPYVIGTIQEIRSNNLHAPFVVVWPDGINSYSSYDLIFCGKNDKAKKTKKLVKPVGPTMDSVILSEDKKEQIKAAISQKENDDKIFNKWGFSEVFEKGTAISLLFYGIPGTGKTLMAEAVANDLKVKLKTIGVAEIQSSEPGGAERAIQLAFAGAKRAGELLLFDECDMLLIDRNEVGPILGAMVNTLLMEIEKFTGVVIFTTNRLGKLDPALERRITTKVEFPFPDETQRELIWKRMLPKKAPLDKQVNLKVLAKYPIAGGNIKNAVLSTARMAAYQKAKYLTMTMFLECIEKEITSLNSFLKHYNDNPHQQNLGMQMSEGMEIKQTITEGIKNGK